METFLKLFFLSLMSCTEAEPLQESGYGLNSGVQVTACSRRGARCEGAAVVAEWVLVINSCIVAQNIENIYVQKGIVNCTQERTTPVMGANNESSVRGVVARFSHPRAPGVDLALLKVDWPYEDQIDNFKLPEEILDMLDKWMEHLLSSTVDTYMLHETDDYTQMQSLSIKMFFVAVILPAVSFIIFFLFIVFFTGSTNTSKIPYKTLINSKYSKSDV